ncbi:MAG: fructose-6-phosphate aldolase [Vampirovibrio sp.]
MKLFVDTADLAEIREAATLGVVSGVTTNPSLLAKAGHGDVKATIQEICQIFPNSPVSMEVMSDDAEGMIQEGQEFATWADHIYVKIPFGLEGMKAVAALSAQGIKTNVTLVFSPAQALLAARAGASFISTFVGRLDDIGQDGMTATAEIVEMLGNYAFDSEILAASIRHPLHVVQAAQAGCDIATIPLKILKQMYQHPLTTSGIAAFKKDWAAQEA